MVAVAVDRLLYMSQLAMTSTMALRLAFQLTVWGRSKLQQTEWRRVACQYHHAFGQETSNVDVCIEQLTSCQQFAVAAQLGLLLALLSMETCRWASGQSAKNGVKIVSIKQRA